jgi:membrane associated rhomboid family serine protease
MMPSVTVVDEELERCYRHPDRETALHCANCGRPICPECMTATPVGQRCPECVGQHQQRVRRPASMAYEPPIITYGLIGACVLFFVYIQHGLGGNADVQWALVGSLVQNGEYWRMVSAMFLHANIIHLAFNMYALWAFGPAIEARYGHARYFLLYMASGLCGSAGALVLSSPFSPTVGASGAIFGLMGAYVAIAKVHGARDMGGIGAVIAINLFITISVPGISIGGHVGGLLGGVLCGLGYETIGRKFRGPAMIATSLLFAAALSATMLVFGGSGIGVGAWVVR